MTVPYSDRRNVVVEIKHGSVLRGREDIVYARVNDAETGELLISATLDYVLRAAVEYGYNFVTKE